jgi:hypothetical protein
MELRLGTQGDDLFVLVRIACRGEQKDSVFAEHVSSEI